MANAEKFLHQHFASLDDTSSGATPHILPDSQVEALDDPFAKVNTVASGSPAELAGLQAGDEIRNFGYVNRSNHDSLKKVAECVQVNEGVCRAAVDSNRLETNLSLEQRLHPSVAACGRGPASRAALNLDSETRLGRTRDAWLSHYPTVELHEEIIKLKIASVTT